MCTCVCGMPGEKLMVYLAGRKTRGRSGFDATVSSIISQFNWHVRRVTFDFDSDFFLVLQECLFQINADQYKA